MLFFVRGGTRPSMELPQVMTAHCSREDLGAGISMDTRDQLLRARGVRATAQETGLWRDIAHDKPTRSPPLSRPASRPSFAPDLGGDEDAAGVADAEAPALRAGRSCSFADPISEVVSAPRVDEKGSVRWAPIAIGLAAIVAVLVILLALRRPR